jgi:hypothetical protein
MWYCQCIMRGEMTWFQAWTYVRIALMKLIAKVDDGAVSRGHDPGEAAEQAQMMIRKHVGQ